MLMQHSVNSDWLFNAHSRVLQGDWVMLENNEKGILNINMPFFRIPQLARQFQLLSLDNSKEYPLHKSLWIDTLTNRHFCHPLWTAPLLIVSLVVSAGDVTGEWSSLLSKLGTIHVSRYFDARLFLYIHTEWFQKYCTLNKSNIGEIR